MTNTELLSKIKDFVNEQKELLSGFELQSDFRRGETAAYSVVLSFLSDLEKSGKPINPVIQDFPTTEKEMQDFLATHERIPVPERLNSLERILQEQPVCEGLEEEIERYLHSLGVGYGGWVDGMEDDDLRGIARHFAQWGAEHLKR